MPVSTNDDWYFGGSVRFGGSASLQDSSVGNQQINPASPIAAEKSVHQYQPKLAQAHGSSATAERRIVHVANAAGSLVAVKVVPVVAALGDSTATIDVKKNGASMLGSTVAINSSKAAYSATLGTVSGSGAYVAGDVIEVVQTVSAGTGTLPQGVCTEIVLREAAG